MTVTDVKLVSMKEMLKEAKQAKYAIGQFNINGLQWTKAILLAAEEENSPVIVAASDRLVDYLGGFQTIVGMVEGLMRDLSITVPVALHLDHGASVARCQSAIEAGFSSVMIDGSSFSLKENIRMTNDVVSYAMKRGVSVEAEIGSVGGMEDGMIGNIVYANPLDCHRLVQETNVDALAAALGSVHGPYQGEPKLGFEEMKDISERTDIPLVLHGGSGIPVEQIQRAISLGHAKINVNTECLLAWNQAIRSKLKEDADIYDPQTILTPGTEAIKSVVKMKMREFGSSQRIR